MWKMLIADDEQLERKVIKSTIVKKYKNEICILEAKNGREAIEIADRERPHIFVMDIKMPGIDGIESIKEIRRFNKDAYFIILTAYDYFNFAKEAIEYDVKEYLLKPFNRDSFLKKLDKAMEYLEEIKREKKKKLVLKEQIYNVKPMIENQLAYGIIKNNLNSIDYNMCMECLDINFESSYAVIVRLNEKYEYKNLKLNDKKDLRNKIIEFIREIFGRYYKGIVNGIFANEIVIFIQNEVSDEYSTRIESINFGRKLRKEVKSKFGVSLSLGVGKEYNGIDNLVHSYKEAYVALNHNIKDVNVKHFLDISAILDAENLEYELHSKYIEDNNEYEFLSLCRCDESDVKSILKKSLKYIENNYNKELTLEKIANNFNLSPYYFSRTFKEIIGENYSEYVTKIRIKKAKQLLEHNNLSIKEISFRVGYKDPNYFSRVFKKVEKVSPKQYKIKMNL